MGVLSVAVWPVAAHAEDDFSVPSVYTDLVACRAMTDDAARLACFDAKTAALQSATDSSQIVIVDREEVREAERGLFGLRLPRIRLFGGGGDDDGEEEQHVDRIETTVTAASGGQRGRPWILRLGDGSLWTQIDSVVLPLAPRPGTAIVIHRAALGSYRAVIQGMRPLRVRRVE